MQTPAVENLGVLNEDRFFVSKSLEGKIGPQELVEPSATDNKDLIVKIQESELMLNSIEESEESIDITGTCFARDIAGIFSDNRPDKLQVFLDDEMILNKDVKHCTWQCKANTFSSDNYDVSILITRKIEGKKKQDGKR